MTLFLFHLHLILERRVVRSRRVSRCPGRDGSSEVVRRASFGSLHASQSSRSHRRGKHDHLLWRFPIQRALQQPSSRRSITRCLTMQLAKYLESSIPTNHPNILPLKAIVHSPPHYFAVLLWTLFSSDRRLQSVDHRHRPEVQQTLAAVAHRSSLHSLSSHSSAPFPTQPWNPVSSLLHRFTHTHGESLAVSTSPCSPEDSVPSWDASPTLVDDHRCVGEWTIDQLRLCDVPERCGRSSHGRQQLPLHHAVGVRLLVADRRLAWFQYF